MNSERLTRTCLGITLVVIYTNFMVYFKTYQPDLMQGALLPRAMVALSAVGIMIGCTLVAITLLELIEQKGQQKKKK